MCAVFADYVRSNKLLILRVLAVTKNENKALDSPAESVILIWWLAIGYQPLATEFLALFSFTAAGKAFPLFIPRKTSLLVSKPSTGLFTLKKL